MFGLLFASVLVGVPAFIAAYIFVKPSSDRDRATSLGLGLYAVALVSAFVWLHPGGKILQADFRLTMPLALCVGAVVGVALGLARR